MGARAYKILTWHADIEPGECVVEIGSERGEGSTRWISAFCWQRAIPFHTVDIDPLVYDRAVAIVSPHPTSQAHHSSGEAFLCQLDERIRFAYLDSYDCIPEGLEEAGFVEDCRRRYEEMGMTLSNGASARSHLEQALLVEEHAAPRCTVLIDDTFFRRRWVGKGAEAVPYLEQRGFAVSDLGGAALAVR